MFEMLQIENLKTGLLKLHTSMRSESSKFKLGRIRQQKSVKLCIPSINSRISDLRTGYYDQAYNVGNNPNLHMLSIATILTFA